MLCPGFFLVVIFLNFKHFFFFAFLLSLATDPLSSPTGPSAADIFSSPQPGSAKRRLFAPVTVSASGISGGEPVLLQQLNSGVADTVAASTRSASAQQQASGNTPQTLMAYTNDGRQVSENLYLFLNSKQMPVIVINSF